MLYLLVLILFGMLILNYVLFDKKILSPSFVFNGSFFISCTWALFYAKKWDLNLHLNTFFVILGGVCIFTLIAMLIHNGYLVSKEATNVNDLSLSSQNLVTSKKIGFILIIEIVTILMTILFLKVAAPSGNLSDSIYIYRVQSLRPVSNLRAMPKGLKILRMFTESAGTFFAFILVRKWIFYRKCDYLSLLVVLLSIASGLLLGSRGGLVSMIIFIVVSFYFVKEKKYSWKNKKSFKHLMLMIVLGFFLLFFFQGIATLLGRAVSNYSLSEYLSIYIAAEIKNLDIFLQNSIIPIGNGMFGEQTFISLYKTFGSQIHALNLPFLYVNGNDLGNVYTTFYPYVYDFGYLGVPLLISLMALISQYVFERAKLFVDDGSVPIYILVYSKITSCLALAFFSNKFYENIFSVIFLEQLIIWIMLNIILCKVNFKFNWRD